MSEEETGSGSISKNETRSGRSSSREHGVQPTAIDSRPRRDPEPCELEDAFGILPREERGELVGADEEHRIVEPRAPRGSRRVRANGSSRPRRLVERAERELGEKQPDVGRRADLLVPRILDDPDEQPVEREVLDAPPRELDVADVRRVERAAEDADRYDATRAPRRRSRRAPPCGSRRRGAPPRARRLGRVADDAVAAFDAQDAEPAPCGRRRAVVEELGQRRLLLDRSGASGQRAKRACFSSAMPAPVAQETRWTATMRSSSTVNGAGSGLRSDLLRTTICGRSSSPAP